jgi:PAS domain S-box-containing protein
VVGFVALRNLPGVGPGMRSLMFVAVFASSWYGGTGPGLMTTGFISLMLATSMLKDVEATLLARTANLLLFVMGSVVICVLVRAGHRARRKVDELARIAFEQSERFRTILQSIGDAVIVTDRRGTVVSLNPVAEALTGWTQAEAQGAPLAEVFRVADEETRAEAEDPVDKVLDAKTVVGLAKHSVLLRRDGKAIPISDSASPIRRGDGPIDGVVLVFRDASGPRAAERRLLEAQSRFQAFMDHSPIVAYMKDEEGRYIWANSAWGKLYEGGLEASLGKTDYDLWPPETASRFRAFDAKALTSSTPVEVEEPSTSLNGSTSFWISMKFRFVDSELSRFVGGVSVDVTQRIRAQEALRESEARYRMLFESNPHPMWVFDSETLVFLAVNNAAVAKYGYSREEFQAMTILEIRPAEDAPLIRARMDLYHTTAFLGQSQWRHKMKDGTIIEVEIASHAIDFEGRPARLVLAHDVTARHHAEEALRISRERLDLVLNGAELGLWYCDVLTVTFTLNDRARTHFGYGPDEEMTSDSFFERLHPDDKEATRAAAERAIADGTIFDVEYRICLAGHPERWVRAIARGFYDESGRAIRFDGITIDVTEQKRAEAQLVEAKEAAIEANRAKDKFLAVLGHELRTPLTPVLASVSAMLDNPPPSGPDGPDWPPGVVHETLAMIRRNIELETRLISDLLDVSRVERGQLRLELERIDMHDAIRQAVDICRDELLVSGLEVRLELEAEQHEVDADHARVLQIVWNLIHNAAKFSPSESRLTIRSRNTPSRDPEHPAPRLVVEFEDAGFGIEPEMLPRIFDPFEQGTTAARRRLGGLGLGLAISRSIAEAHGGGLTAASGGRGQGSTFRLELITTGMMPNRDSPRTSAPASPAWSPRNILLVEDNPDTLRYLMTLLRHRGYQVTPATRAEEALALADETSFEVLISDIELPDGSGLDVMRALRGKVVGVAMSGFGSDSDVEMSLDAGFSTHITKPIDFARLEAAIRDALAVSSG